MLPRFKLELCKFGSQLISTHPINATISHSNFFVNWVTEIIRMAGGNFFIIVLSIQSTVMLALEEKFCN